MSSPLLVPMTIGLRSGMILFDLDNGPVNGTDESARRVGTAGVALEDEYAAGAVVYDPDREVGAT